jgi:uncharacterized protein
LSNGPSEPGITVTGIGHSSVPPDLMTVGLGISVLAATVADARALASSKAMALISSVKDRGVNDDDIQTTHYTIHPEYDHEDGRRNLRGYRVSNEVEVTLRDLDTAGELLDAAAAAGGDETNVNNISFAVEDQGPARDRARELAWGDAVARAEHLARLSGFELGKAMSIVESTNRQPGPIPAPRLAMLEADATPIEAGATAFTVTLEVRFGLG